MYLHAKYLGEFQYVVKMTKIHRTFVAVYIFVRAFDALLVPLLASNMLHSS